LETVHSTREKLIQAARKCLLEIGHSATTVKEIAKSAGVNHGLVHHYFGSKENLFVEILSLEWEEFDRKAEKIFGREDLIEFLIDHLFMNARLFAEFTAMAQTMPVVKKVMNDLFNHRRKQLKERFHFSDEITPYIILATVGGLALQYTIDRSIPVKRVLTELFRPLQMKT
jgi:AcrR family transcriptional regulator